MKREVTALAAAWLLAGASAAWAQGQWSAGVGYNYSTGDYGTSTTTKIHSVPFTLRYDRDRWSFKATLPYLEISGSNAVVPGIGQVVNTNPRGRGRGNAGAAVVAAPAATTTSTTSGWGDLSASATYNAWHDAAAKMGLDLTGKVKLATADRDKGLGTGENDFGVYAEAYKTFDRVTAFGGVGYTFLGRSEFIQLDDVWNASVGGLYRVDERHSAGLAFDWRERTSPSSFAQRELTAFWSTRLDRHWKGQAYVLKGLSDGSPDWGFGISAAYAF